MGDGDFEGRPGIIVVAEELATITAAERAARAASRLLDTVDWAQAAGRAAAQIGPATFLVETAGIDPERIAGMLPDLIATLGAARTVVCFGPEALDVVGGALLGSEAILLCDPVFADRVAALALAGAERGLTLRDSGGEAERLALINQEVARFAATLARLTNGDAGDEAARAPIVGDRRGGYGGPPPGPAPTVTGSDIRRAIRARRLRDEAFGTVGLFEDPAWDMLLDLYAAELERGDVSVSSLCIAAAVAPTTALRWINRLIEHGLLERRPDSTDRRRAFVALSARGSATMRDYLATLARAGLSIA